MKLLKLTYLCIFAMLLSCSEFLEQEPGTQTSVNELYSTQEGFQMALSGAYRSLASVSLKENMLVYADLLGGNITFSPNASGNSKGEIRIPYLIENCYSFNDQSESSDFSGNYGSLYTLIRLANDILEQNEIFNGFSNNKKNEIKAEALCIRAYAHFLLLRLYAQHYGFTSDGSHPGVVVATRQLKIGVDYPARETVAKTYELILKDMEEAIPLFNNEYLLEGERIYYFTETAAKALLSRFYLYAQQWQKALDNANEVITGSGFTLTTKEQYIREWAEPNAPVTETILELLARLEDGVLTDGASECFYYQDSLFYGDYVATGDLLDMYDPKDIRSADSMFIKASLSTISKTDTLVKPFYFTKKMQDNAGVNVIRLSELYLIAAEAAARLEDFNTSINYLNVIRERAGLPKVDSNENLLDEIFTERRRELCFEGHLFFDLARFQKNVVRNQGCLASTCNLTYPSSYFILPIPERNVEINSNMQQNEGY